MKPVIYKITSPTNRMYIGQSWNWKNRLSQYKCLHFKNKYAIHRSLLKYGANNHIFEVVHELPEDINQEVLDNYEILYWNLYKSCGVSMLNIKEPGRGGKVAEETKDRISKALKGKTFSEETIRRRVETWKKLGRSEKQKKQIKNFYKKDGEHGKARKVIDTRTNEVFVTIKDAANSIGINYSTLGYYLRGVYTNKTNFRFL